MPQQQDPNAPPETLLLHQFLGVKNNVNEERLGPNDFVYAHNVDMDDVGQPRRRRGFAQVDDTPYHSLWPLVSGGVVGVRGSVLGRINTDYTFTSLVTGIFDPLVYVEINATLYYSSRVQSGKINLMTGAATSWGSTSGDGTWLSPVTTPAIDSLNAIAGKLLRAPPLATDLTYLNGRIYLAAGPLLWATELYLYDYVDSTKNFRQFEDNITGIRAVTDGIYVGTEGGVYFLSGNNLAALRLKKIMDEPMIPGSMLTVPASSVKPALRQANQEEEAVLFMTTGGLCVGFENGVCYNLTMDRVEFPTAVRASAMLRKQDGMTTYVAVTETGGTPKSAAAIGDYVDVEIRRANREPGGVTLTII